MWIIAETFGSFNDNICKSVINSMEPDSKIKPWAQNDTLFKKELEIGHAWQDLPATFFRLHGFSAEVTELKFRESISEASKWLDSADLIINNFFILEVKSRNETFTSPQSFPYQTALVDTVAGYDGKSEKPLAYIMISRPTGAMLCLRSGSSQKWTKQKKFDNVRKIECEFYLCDKKMLQPLDVLVNYIKMVKK